MNTPLILLLASAYVTVLLQSYTNASDVEIDTEIIQGQTANRGQFPYMVEILFRRNHHCGAAIASQRWLISAAHCYYDYKDPSQYQAVAGLLKRGEQHQDNQAIPINRIISHPQYQHHSLTNDISVMQLKVPLKFSGAVKPIGLPQPNSQVSGKVIVSGWGYVRKNPDVFASILQYVELNLITNAECAKTWPMVNTKMCTIGSGSRQSTCQGDSGGPLVQNNVLVGVVSGGDRMCGTTSSTAPPMFYTRVSSFIDFIRQHMTD